MSATALAAGLVCPGLHARGEPAGPRSLVFVNLHTGEELAADYWRDGRYDSGALSRIDHILRDHRADEATSMNRDLLDLLHRLKSSLGGDVPFHVISGYRSPQTNQALRKHSNGVAKRSLHMQGKAIDIRIPDVKTGALYEAALALQGGGVGLYRKSGFIHLDVGRVRTWRG
jgi:uncharacterized protein YcbK (DUF882 family)